MHEDAGIKHLEDPDAFIECSNAMDDVYEVLMITTQTDEEKS